MTIGDPFGNFDMRSSLKRLRYLTEDRKPFLLNDEVLPEEIKSASGKNPTVKTIIRTLIIFILCAQRWIRCYAAYSSSSRDF